MKKGLKAKRIKKEGGATRNTYEKPSMKVVEFEGKNAEVPEVVSASGGGPLFGCVVR